MLKRLNRICLPASANACSSTRSEDQQLQPSGCPKRSRKRSTASACAKRCCFSLHVSKGPMFGVHQLEDKPTSFDCRIPWKHGCSWTTAHRRPCAKHSLFNFCNLFQGRFFFWGGFRAGGMLPFGSHAFARTNTQPSAHTGGDRAGVLGARAHTRTHALTTQLA